MLKNTFNNKYLNYIGMIGTIIIYCILSILTIIILELCVRKAKQFFIYLFYFYLFDKQIILKS